MSQKCGNDVIWFQYGLGGAPLGFVYNNTQYFYVTNQLGDVVGITDDEGNLLCTYEYDEWGTVLSITSIDNDAQAIAEMNPLRYRGYYYDSETGYYYLQSRYYDPSICRFINADDFDFIDESNTFSVNAFLYCDNNPIIYTDITGKYKEEPLNEQVGKILGVIFATIGAQAQYGDDFAALVALKLTYNPDLVFFKRNPQLSTSENDKRRKEHKDYFENFLEKLYEEFKKTADNKVYKFLKFFKDDFFIDICQKAIESKETNGVISVSKYLRFTFGVGNQNGFLAQLDSLLNSHISFYSDKNGFDMGIITKPNTSGAYFSHTVPLVNDNFYVNTTLDVEVSFNRLKKAFSYVTVDDPDFTIPIEVTNTFSIIMLSTLIIGVVILKGVTA